MFLRLSFICWSSILYFFCCLSWWSDFLVLYVEFSSYFWLFCIYNIFLYFHSSPLSSTTLSSLWKLFIKSTPFVWSISLVYLITSSEFRTTPNAAALSSRPVGHFNSLRFLPVPCACPFRLLLILLENITFSSNLSFSSLKCDAFDARTNKSLTFFF